MENAMLERIRTLAVEMKPGMLDLAQRIIRCPSLTGEEKGVADILLDELNKLGYDDVFRDDWGNVVGIVHGTENGPTIMYNGHMDHVDIGAVSEWMGYDPYGGAIDVDDMYERFSTPFNLFSKTVAIEDSITSALAPVYEAETLT